MYFYNVDSVKQQSAGRHVASFWHIILISIHLVYAFTLLCSVLSEEIANTNFIFFGLTRPGLKHTIYHTRSNWWDRLKTVAGLNQLMGSQPCHVHECILQMIRLWKSVLTPIFFNNRIINMSVKWDFQQYNIYIVLVSLIILGKETKVDI